MAFSPVAPDPRFAPETTLERVEHVAPSHMPPPTSEEKAGPALVTIVDDDEEIASALGSWFELCGLRTALHACAESLLLALNSREGELLHDIGPDETARPYPLSGAVLDLNLGGMNGVELARKLRALKPALPIVIISALPKEALSRYGELPEGVSFLKKPFDLEVLEEALFPRPLSH